MTCRAATHVFDTVFKFVLSDFLALFVVFHPDAVLFTFDEVALKQNRPVIAVEVILPFIQPSAVGLFPLATVGVARNFMRPRRIARLRAGLADGATGQQQ